MNSSDEEDVLILLSLRRRRKRKRQSIWCREYFLLRESRGEFQRTILHPLDNPDGELFFNYTRMSYSTYNALKSLVLELLKPDRSNWRKSISAEEKLIITLRRAKSCGITATTGVETKDQWFKIASVLIKLKGESLKVIQVYAPTSDYEDTEMEAFYEDLAKAMEMKGRGNIIIMGDFNAKIGTK
ncbi:endonuclease-reverse transcriptase [Elysia marginata]|uniref:Endonuclease-reverse transcriptase n=1 Tax=Elysia marginata TaxID=1093978 RepID=A0AAV4HHU2_9GAST|nr:endonuclease-reverse transcriptase [Elysia marginata]